MTLRVLHHTAPVRRELGSGLDGIRGLMRHMWVLSASSPVSSCQLAGSPASHGQLCVARAFHCQAQLVSSAQRPSVGYSRCSCPATAAFGLSQLCIPAAPPSSPSAIRSRCSLPALEVSAAFQLDLSSAHLQPHLSLGSWLVSLARSHLLSGDLLPCLLATSSNRGRQGPPSDLSRLSVPAPRPSGPCRI